MTATPAPGASGYRWVMLGLLCLGYGSFGLVSASLAPLLSSILPDTGMSRSEMGVVLGSWQFVYLFVAIPIGALVDNFGLRRALFVGIALVAVSQGLRAAAIDQWSMLGAVMVFGLGGPFLSIGAPKLAVTWFSREQVGMALGIYTVSPSVGSVIATSSANSVVMPSTGDSWRLTLLVFAGVAAIAAIAWLLLAREAPAEAADEPVSRQSALGGFRELLRLRVVQVVLLMSVGSFLINHSLNSWLPEMLRSGGMSATEAGFWASVPTLVAVGAALLAPRLATERRLTAVQIAVFSMWGIGLILVSLTGIATQAGLLLVGIGRGGGTPLLMLALLRSPRISPSLMGAAGALFFTAGEVGGVLGPTLTGILADSTGGYGTTLGLLAAVAGVLALTSLVLSAASGRAA